jgi:hypothetical protein
MEGSEINLDDLLRLSKLLKRKRSKKYYAERLGVSIRTIERYTKQLNRLKKPSAEESLKKENIEEGTLESIRTIEFLPSNHKELAIIHSVDLKVFKITNYWSKLKPDGKYTSSIFCKRKTPQDYSLEDFSKFLKNYKSNYIPRTSIESLVSKSTIDVEISVSDLHLAKKYVDEKNLKVKERSQKFYNIVEKLLLRTLNFYNIDEIVFPISNDFFHSDTYWNTTTKGTPQDVIAEYDEEYEVGFDLLVRCITLMKTICNKLTVILVPGNHDRTKGFYLAHALEVYFKGLPSISFLRNKNNEKAVILGNTFIGYHHGNCKIEQLPLLFATHPENAVNFGKAKFREVHTGDKHHYMAKEVKGVRIQQMPSMSGNDRYHKDNLFVHNIRAALLLMYDKEKGKIGELEERL